MRSSLFEDFDIIVDGTDNFPTRYLVNDACVLLGKPNVYGSIFRFEGQASVFYAREGPCYRCLYPEPPPPGLVPSCAEGGVLGVLPGIVGCIQAMETIKLIIGQGESLIGRLLMFDALRVRFRELKLRKNPDVPGLRDASHNYQADRLRAVLRDSRRGAHSLMITGIPEIEPQEVKQMMDEKQPLRPDRRAGTARVPDLPHRRRRS